MTQNIAPRIQPNVVEVAKHTDGMLQNSKEAPRPKNTQKAYGPRQQEWRVCISFSLF